MWEAITVGKCENTNDKKKEDETAEAAPEVVLQTGIAPSINSNTTYSMSL